MNNIRIVGNNIKDAFKSVFRNFSLSLASISCITITLILVGVAMLLSLNVNNFTEDIEKDVTIVAFIEKGTMEEDINAIENHIKSLSNIESITFLSNESIRKEMSEESEELSSILGQYDSESNPLLDEYLIKVVDVEKISSTAHQIEEIDKITSVRYGEGMVEELVKVFNIVKNITYIVVIGLSVVTVFLISNTIKITINNRKRQIEIMRLVGASNPYIKRPFFVEGIVLGFLGSLIPVLVIGWGYIYLYGRMGGVLFTKVITMVNPDEILLPLALKLMAMGVIVGAFGSSWAVRRHLKI